MTQPYSVVLADNHARFRRELKRIIEDASDQKVVGEAADWPELFSLLEQWRPRLVILDVSLPKSRAIEAILQMKARAPGLKVLILIWEWDAEYILRTLAAGASGCLLKQEVGSQLSRAVRIIRGGGKFFPLKVNELAESRRYA